MLVAMHRQGFFFSHRWTVRTSRRKKEAISFQESSLSAGFKSVMDYCDHDIEVRRNCQVAVGSSCWLLTGPAQNNPHSRGRLCHMRLALAEGLPHGYMSLGIVNLVTFSG